MNRGLLFIATDDSYLQEAIQSAKQAANVVDLPISIVSHKKPESDVFDKEILDENPTNTVADKSRNLLKTPYDQTIFLDTDTYILEEISELFDLLKRSPLAVTLDVHEGSLWTKDRTNIPDSFPEFQTGVIVYQTTQLLCDFIESWQDKHTPLYMPDQLSFRKTAYEHQMQINTFPLRYNTLVGTQVFGPVKILHDHNRFLKNCEIDSLYEILTNVNEHQGIRVLNTFHFKYIPEVSLLWPLPVRLVLAAIKKLYITTKLGYKI